VPTERFVNAAVAVGASTGNLLANSKFLYAPGPMAVVVYAVADTAGGQLTLTFGNTIEADRVAIQVKAATVGPLIQEDQLCSGIALGGDQINVNCFNSSAAVMNFRTLIVMRPL